MALLLLGLGAILIPPMLANVSSRVVSARDANFDANESYCTDAGVEDALWDLEYDDMASVVPNPDDTTSYQITDPVNGSVVNVTVTNEGTVVAADDFESGDWTGGTGWDSGWLPSGIVDVHNFEQPYEGDYHVRMRSDSAYIEREVYEEVSGQPQLRLQLWGRAKNFDAGDQAELQVHDDDTSWTVLQTWTVDDSDDTYHYFDIDLTPYNYERELTVALEVSASNPGDKFFVDDIKFVRAPTYEIVVTCGDKTATVNAAVDNGDVTILSWIKS